MSTTDRDMSHSYGDDIIVGKDRKGDVVKMEKMKSKKGRPQLRQTYYVDFADGDKSLAAHWHKLITTAFHKPIKKLLSVIARWSATNPKWTIFMVVLLSCGLLVTGLFTNFYLDTNEDTLWSPLSTRPVSHFDWINGGTSGFPDVSRPFRFHIHANGENVVSQEGLQKTFDALAAVLETPGYAEICTDLATCPIASVTGFWDHSTTVFQQEIQSNKQAAIAKLSQPMFPDGKPVDLYSVMGKPEVGDDGLITSSLVYLTMIDLSVAANDLEKVIDFEEMALERILDLQELWETEVNNPFRLEVFAERSFADEFTRAIVKDIPLVPGIFMIMSIFTALIFFRRDRVRSQSLLGLGAVMGVLFSIMSGYGLLFACGVNFTSMTQILPFVIFGIGLDDAFILSGTFYRLDSSIDILERVERTIDEVGISITLTTLTSALAFGLGSMSSIPGIRWLCQYAFPTILIDFLYQITYFIAVMVLDERRVAANRKDCLICCTAKNVVEDEEPTDDTTEEEATVQEEDDYSATDRFMLWYADKLLHPGFKFLVVLSAIGLLGGCAYSASLLTQEFDFTEVIPEDSYITAYFEVLQDFTDRDGATIEVFFRNEDQSSPDVRQQMLQYVEEMVEIPQVTDGPPFFWVTDFETFIQDDRNDLLQDRPFHEQMKAFLDIPVYKDLYKNQIALDPSDGHILASKTLMFMNRVNQNDVNSVVDALQDQREVGARQPINAGKEEWSFFTFTTDYMIWQFYSQSVQELTMTTIWGVGAVIVLSLLFMPHWTAVLFTGPLICILYIDLLGILQFAGVHINPLSYVAMVMSIGLMVDFLIHTLMRYYEVKGDRVTRTKEMLRTMGSSVLIGGISTFLGVLPLAFSTSTVFFTIFVTFMGLVTLGITHGLILLPVILSTIGPESVEVDYGSEPSIIVEV